LHESNIKVKAGKMVILDFNISGKNHIVDELAWIINWYFIDKNRIDQIGKLLKIYQQNIPLNRSELNLLKELLVLYSRLQYSDFKRIKDNRDLQDTFGSIKKLHNKLKVQIK